MSNRLLWLLLFWSLHLGTCKISLQNDSVGADMIKLVADAIIDDDDVDIILLTTEKDIPKAIKNHHNKGTMISYDPKYFTDLSMAKIKQTVIEDNIDKIVYLLIPSFKENDNNLLQISTEIRRLDPSNPILLFINNASILRSTAINDIFNSYFILTNENHKFELFQVCMFCNEGENVVEKSNSWITEKGFR